MILNIKLSTTSTASCPDYHTATPLCRVTRELRLSPPVVINGFVHNDKNLLIYLCDYVFAWHNKRDGCDASKNLLIPRHAFSVLCLDGTATELATNLTDNKFSGRCATWERAMACCGYRILCSSPTCTPTHNHHANHPRLGSSPVRRLFCPPLFHFLVLFILLPPASPV